MTVQELISKLELYPPSAEVRLVDDLGEYPVTTVEKIEEPTNSTVAVLLY